MKHLSLKYIVLSAIFVFTGMGCQKYLDINPKGVDVVSTINQYDGLFNNALLTTLSTYTAGAGFVSPGIQMNLSVMMSNEATTTDPYSGNFAYNPRYMFAYHWEPTIYQQDENSGEWSAPYQHMYTYNVIAKGVMNSTDGTLQEKKQLLAEARANRAYLYLLLINYFGKPYDPVSAADDPGVPLITEPDASASAGPRVSVQGIYDFIIRELKAGITDLPDNTSNRLRLAKPAATCMLAQTYFFQEKYDSALAELNTAEVLLQNNTAPMNLYDYNVTISQWTPSFPGATPNIPRVNVNEEWICSRAIPLYPFIGTAFLDPAYVALYDTSDLRLKLYSANDYAGNPYPSLTKAAMFNANYGPSMPDVYLMLAECKARTGDIAGATADLVRLRQNRMPADKADVSITNQDDLVRFIIDERYREFALTGYNWFDVRRLWNDPLFAGKNYIHSDNTGTSTLTADRLVLKVPPKIININPDMVNNP